MRIVKPLLRIHRRWTVALTYHPFSFSSSAEHPDRVTFTIKQYAGFIRSIADLQPGEIVYIDGPFGMFVLPHSKPLVLVGAGVGLLRCSACSRPLLTSAPHYSDLGVARRRHCGDRRAHQLGPAGAGDGDAGVLSGEPAEECRVPGLPAIRLSDTCQPIIPRTSPRRLCRGLAAFGRAGGLYTRKVTRNPRALPGFPRTRT